ncbi:MAG: hypothetical protein PHI35_00175 [Victivallaceae bacterium]|nr:hypothetical protein [Victivallaceae bacterium]
MRKWVIVLSVAAAAAFLTVGCRCAEDVWDDCDGKGKTCCGNPSDPNCPSHKKMNAKDCPMLQKDTKACPMQQSTEHVTEKAQ